jgi:hypothetical protein
MPKKSDRGDDERFGLWSSIGVQFSVIATTVAVASYATPIPGAGGLLGRY